MNTVNLNNLTGAKNECTHNVLEVRQAPGEVLDLRWWLDAKQCLPHAWQTPVLKCLLLSLGFLLKSSLNTNQITHFHPPVFHSWKPYQKPTVNICASDEKRQRKPQRPRALHTGNVTTSPCLSWEGNIQEIPYYGIQKEGGSLGRSPELSLE